MKPQFSKALKKAVAAQMAVRLPQFEPLDRREGLTYRSLHSEGNWSFIRFETSGKSWQAFTVELARSSDGLWPERAFLSMPVSIPERQLICTIPRSEPFRFRIGFLFPPHKDDWWELTPKESLESIISRLQSPDYGASIPDPPPIDTAKLSSLVSDALDKICNYGLPFLAATFSESSG